MKKSSRTIRHLQRCRDQRLTSKARRLNKMAKDRWRQLLRSRIVIAIINFFKLLVDWLPKSAPPPTEPTPEPTTTAMAA